MVIKLKAYLFSYVKITRMSLYSTVLVLFMFHKKQSVDADILFHVANDLSGDTGMNHTHT